MPYSGGLDVGAVTYVTQWELPPAIRRVLPDGYLMTVARGPFTADDGVYQPEDVAAGRSGELYFTADHTVRVRLPDGSFRVLAGALHDAGDEDGPGALARFSSPKGIVYDGLRTLSLRSGAAGSCARWIRSPAKSGRWRAARAFPRARPARAAASATGRASRRSWTRPGTWRWTASATSGSRTPTTMRSATCASSPIPRARRRSSIWCRAPTRATRRASSCAGGTSRSPKLHAGLGADVAVTVERASQREAVLRVEVAAGADPGVRSLHLEVRRTRGCDGAGLGFTILAEARGGATVETLAGIGSLAEAGQDVVPGPLTAFVLPTGLFAESGDRILVADPYLHAVRLVATRTGIVAEIIDLITASTIGMDVNALDAVIGGLGSLGTALEGLGIRQAWTDQAQDAIRDAAEAAVDAACAGQDCTWMSMPWAGVPLAPGESGGFRLGARLRFPTNVTRADASTYASPTPATTGFTSSATTPRRRTTR